MQGLDEMMCHEAKDLSAQLYLKDFVHKVFLATVNQVKQGALFSA